MSYFTLCPNGDLYSLKEYFKFKQCAVQLGMQVKECLEFSHQVFKSQTKIRTEFLQLFTNFTKSRDYNHEL